uniref:Uncharacterized protein n=1 Tax=Myotis myotis TaxID=51298 RepID=A0A7J7RMG7_MYOMY|nr:hypothetical protein mMyoMyo1_010264 [Myotis myotis]
MSELCLCTGSDGAQLWLICQIEPHTLQGKSLRNTAGGQVTHISERRAWSCLLQLSGAASSSSVEHTFIEHLGNRAAKGRRQPTAQPGCSPALLLWALRGAAAEAEGESRRLHLEASLVLPFKSAPHRQWEKNLVFSLLTHTTTDINCCIVLQKTSYSFQKFSIS